MSKRQVRVWLTGKRGAGQFMRLDAEDWEAVARELGDRWSLQRPYGTQVKPHVNTRRRQALQAAGRLANSRSLYLARWLVKPKRGFQVHFLNGDTLDLTRANRSVAPRPNYWRSDRPVRVGSDVPDATPCDAAA